MNIGVWVLSVPSLVSRKECLEVHKFLSVRLSELAGTRKNQVSILEWEIIISESLNYLMGKLYIREENLGQEVR